MFFSSANFFVFVRSESKSISEGDTGCVMDSLLTGLLKGLALFWLMLGLGVTDSCLVHVLRLLNVFTKSVSERSESDSQSSESQWLVPGEAVFESDF